MKKLLFLFLVLLAACIEDPEIKTTKGTYNHGGSDPTALEPCDLDYKWFHDGTTITQYLVNGRYNGNHWNIILNPQWSATGQNLAYFPSVDNVQFKMRVRNSGTQNSFRYRIDNGAWVTLGPGQSGSIFIRTAFGHTPCDNNFAIGPIPFTMDVERLTCGTHPYTMMMSLDCISVSNGHNYGQPGYAINQPITGLIAEGAPGSCQI